MIRTAHYETRSSLMDFMDIPVADGVWAGMALEVAWHGSDEHPAIDRITFLWAGTYDDDGEDLEFHESDEIAADAEIYARFANLLDSTEIVRKL